MLNEHHISNGNGGCASGRAASDIIAQGLSSPATRLVRSIAQL
jgi:hypothetical protein